MSSALTRAQEIAEHFLGKPVTKGRQGRYHRMADAIAAAITEAVAEAEERLRIDVFPMEDAAQMASAHMRACEKLIDAAMAQQEGK